MESRALLKPFVNSGTGDEYFTLFATIIAEIRDLWNQHKFPVDVSIDTNSKSYPVKISFPGQYEKTRDLVCEYQKRIGDLIRGKVFPLIAIRINGCGEFDVLAPEVIPTDSDKTDDDAGATSYDEDDLYSKIVTELHNLWMLVRSDFDVILSPTLNPVVVWITVSNVETEALVNQCVQKIHALVRDKDFPAMQFTVYDGGRVKITNPTMT